VRQLESLGDSDITSQTIGELVMEGLKQIDDVAYVRFASVYRNFREAKDFESLLGELSNDGEPKAFPGEAKAFPGEAKAPRGESGPAPMVPPVRED
jgi:transcriptional repressor NrdR